MACYLKLGKCLVAGHDLVKGSTLQHTSYKVTMSFNGSSLAALRSIDKTLFSIICPMFTFDLDAKHFSYQRLSHSQGLSP